MPPATPRPAASLILLRDTAGGPEVLLGRRQVSAAAFPDVFVFPGGKVEPGDAEAEARAGFPAGLVPAPPGTAHAALRETFEEAGIWLGADGAPATFPQAPGIGRLSAYAHWVTPETRAYRFDTWFFIARAEAGEARTALTGDEFESLAWWAPARMLEAPNTALLPPTRHSLERLVRHGSLAAIFAEARSAGVFEPGEAELRWAAARV
jgi:recombination protein RecT